MDLFTDLSADFSIFIRLFHISFLILSSWNTKGNVHCVIKPIWMSYSLQKVRQRPRSGCGTVCCPTPGYCGLRLLLWRVSPGEPMLHVSLLECSVLISSVPTTSPGNISLKVHRSQKQLKFAFILVLGNFSHSFRFLHYFFFILTK